VASGLGWADVRESTPGSLVHRQSPRPVWTQTVVERIVGCAPDLPGSALSLWRRAV
jgi:hypothetical protein